MNFAPLFMFLSVIIIAVFTFASIATWISARSAERRSRDRSALLRSVAEQPSENARLVLELLREQDATHQREAREHERRGTLQGSFVLIAVGIGLGMMMIALSRESGAWAIGLIPLLIGVALLIAPLFQRPTIPRDHVD